MLSKLVLYDESNGVAGSSR